VATTLNDLAREAGVCKMTVSLALRGKGRMAADTRARIQRLAEDRGYRPNASARAVSNGRHGLVALVMSTHPGRSYLPRDLLLGIESAVAARGSHLLFTHLEDEQLEHADTMPRVLREWSCDGLLLNYHFGIPAALLTHVERHAIPVVWVNADLPQDAVRHDDRAAGILATRHLLDLGHRRIAYADLNFEIARRDGPLHYSRTERRDGYRAAMAAAGLRTEELRDGLPMVGAAIVETVVRRLRGPGRPTAFVLHSQSSLSLFQGACQLSALKVPADLSVVPICNENEVPAWGTLSTTTVGLRQHDLGTGAVDMLWQRMAAADSHLPARTVAPDLAARETSATLPRRCAAPCRRQP